MNRIPRTLAPLAFSIMLAACAATETQAPSPTDAVPSPSATPSNLDGSSAAPASAGASSPGATAEAPADPLLATTLTDVRSGESFTLAELAADGPLLVEPMAVWCSNCRAQQHEVKRAHETATFVSISLDVDLSETPDDLAAYADREGFDWRFAMADAALYRLLQERFGVAATNPPSTPLIVIEADGTVRPLEFGRGTRSAEQLIAELEAG
jgi:hypothetical protein